MTDVIVKAAIAIHATDDDIIIPDIPAMIEFTPYGCFEPIRVGGGDVNSDNSVVFKGAVLPLDYENTKYIYDGINWIDNPDFDLEGV